jgi:hypothetical protein
VPRVPLNLYRSPAPRAWSAGTGAGNELFLLPRRAPSEDLLVEVPVNLNWSDLLGLGLEERWRGQAALRRTVALCLVHGTREEERRMVLARDDRAAAKTG